MGTGRLPTARCPGRADSLVGTGALTLGAAVAGAGVNFVLSVLIGRSFGAAETGRFFAAVGVFLVLANALKLGADTGAVRSMAALIATGRHGDLKLTLLVGLAPVVLIGLLAAGVVSILGGQLSTAEAGGAVSGNLAAVGGVAGFIPLLTVLSVLTGAIRGLGGGVWYAFIQNLLLPVSRLIGVGLAVWLGSGIGEVIRWWAGGLPVLLIVTVSVLARQLRVATEGVGLGDHVERRTHRWTGWSRAGSGLTTRSVFVEFWSFAAPRAGAAAVEIVLEWFDVILVAALAGAHEAGLYAVATRLVKVAMIADQAVRVTMSTRITGWLTLGRFGDVTRLYVVGTRTMIALVWPYAVLLAVFNETVLGLFGADFVQSGGLLLILCVGVMVFAAAGSVQSILLMGGHSSAQLRNKSISLAVCLLGNLLLTPRWGAVGAAVAWTSTILLDTTLAAWHVRRRMSIPVGCKPVLAVGPIVVLSFAGPGLIVRQFLGSHLSALLLTSAIGVLVSGIVLWRNGILKPISDFQDNDG